MAKPANLYAKIEPEIKQRAESISSQPGIPASSAIHMFYKQIILQRGLSSKVKLPQYPSDIGSMRGERHDAELEKDYANMQAGRVVSAE